MTQTIKFEITRNVHQHWYSWPYCLVVNDRVFSIHYTEGGARRKMNKIIKSGKAPKDRYKTELITKQEVLGKCH